MARRLAVWILLIGALGIGVAFQRSDSTESFATSDPITVVDIETGVGDLEVVATATGGASYRRTASRWAGASFDEVVQGGVLHIRADCPSLAILGCDVSYRIEVPAAAMLTLKSGSGSIDVVGGFTGPVRVETGAGPVEVRGPSGPVSIRAGAGPLTASGLGSATVQAATGSGPISLTLTGSPPEVVVAETGSGPVDVNLPPGRYRVVADSGTNTVDIGVETDGQAKAVVTAKTGAGPITVRPVAGSG